MWITSIIKITFPDTLRLNENELAKFNTEFLYLLPNKFINKRPYLMARNGMCEFTWRQGDGLSYLFYHVQEK